MQSITLCACTIGVTEHLIFCNVFIKLDFTILACNIRSWNNMSHKICHFKDFLETNRCPTQHFLQFILQVHILKKGSCICGYYVLLFFHNHHRTLTWCSLYTLCYVSEMKLLRIHDGNPSIPWWWGPWLWTQKDAPTSEYQYWLGVVHPRSFLSAAAWPEWWGHPALPSRIVSLSFWFSWLLLMEVPYLCLWWMCCWQGCVETADSHQTEEGKWLKEAWEVAQQCQTCDKITKS